MPVDRPTFSESWYRVADLRPRLRSTVQVHRQYFRGRMWHVLQDPSSNQFFRLNDAAYHFVALLDGRRTVAEVWRACQGLLGDSAPTQGEAIQLLGQLYTSNLLQADLPPDAEGLFKRYRKRVQREVQSYLMNLLFIRIPLLDPDHFLGAWLKVFGWAFSWVGLALWAGLVGAGLYFVIGRWEELANRVQGVLDMENLPLLYLSFILIKVFHEFGHAFACKKFGVQTGTGGEVHVMGVMFLVFTPMPYMDASSAWAFRSKLHRGLVGAAGMLVETAIAAIAAIVWSQVRSGPINAVCYNVMFIASVSTLLFNGNPLLRYDGYYILSDLVEIPNLAQRSRQYLYYLVRKYAWKVRQLRSPAHSRGEIAWFLFYGTASFVYRVFICVRILLFVADKLFMLGAILAITAVIAWVLVPLGKFFHYLTTSGELMRHRFRAVGSTVAALGVLVGLVTLVPLPDRYRLEGVVEPVDLQLVHAGTAGFITSGLPSGRQVNANAVLATAASADLAAQLDQLRAERRRLEIQRALAQTREVAAAQILAEQIVAMDNRIDRVQEQIRMLEIRSAIAGTWVSPKIDRAAGAYIQRGDSVGLVASDRVFVRAVAGQEAAALILDRALRGDVRGIEIRVKGLPDLEMTGSVLRVIQAGQENLPSAALGYAVGGAVLTDPKDPKGMKAAERFFEVHVRPNPIEDPESFWHGRVPLLSGQRVVVRIALPPCQLARQWYRWLLQLVQRRFRI